MQIGWRSFKKKCWRNVSDRIFSKGDFLATFRVGFYWVVLGLEENPIRNGLKEKIYLHFAVCDYIQQRTHFFFFHACDFLHVVSTDFFLL